MGDTIARRSDSSRAHLEQALAAQGVGARAYFQSKKVSREDGAAGWRAPVSVRRRRHNDIGRNCRRDRRDGIEMIP